MESQIYNLRLHDFKNWVTNWKPLFCRIILCKDPCWFRVISFTVSSISAEYRFCCAMYTCIMCSMAALWADSRYHMPVLTWWQWRHQITLCLSELVHRILTVLTTWWRQTHGLHWARRLGVKGHPLKTDNTGTRFRTQLKSSPRTVKIQSTVHINQYRKHGCVSSHFVLF